LWTRQQIYNKSKQWSMAFDLSTTNRKAIANPQQIEQVEFELYTTRCIEALLNNKFSFVCYTAHDEPQRQSHSCISNN
jgi:hypothetical protein